MLTEGFESPRFPQLEKAEEVWDDIKETLDDIKDDVKDFFRDKVLANTGDVQGVSLVAYNDEPDDDDGWDNNNDDDYAPSYDDNYIDDAWA